MGINGLIIKHHFDYICPLAVLPIELKSLMRIYFTLFDELREKLSDNVCDPDANRI